MSRARALVVRVLVVQEGDQYLAQGIDYDLNAQAPSAQQAIRSFVRLLSARLKRDQELGRTPLADTPQAPQRFFDAWAQLEQQHEDQLTVEAAGGAEENTPPAYIIHALPHNIRGLGLNR